VFHDVCLQHLPVTFALDRAGLVGADGPTHHGVFDFSYLRHLPGIVIMAPKDENELQHMLKTAIDYAGPVAVRYPRGNGLGVQMDETLQNLPIGAAEILKEGSDVAILAIGHSIEQALEAAKNLEEDDHLSVAVINARFVKPLDKELILQLAHDIGRIVTIEENAVQGGFGSAVLELLQAQGIDDVKIRCIGIPDAYIEHGPQSILRHKYGLDAEGVEQVVRRLMSI
jgi:1-deoxy-D-xylulose-5-phosphate synthase